eukprot:5494373-Pyramimonas_sp.AAC.1
MSSAGRRRPTGQVRTAGPRAGGPTRPQLAEIAHPERPAHDEPPLGYDFGESRRRPQHRCRRTL